MPYSPTETIFDFDMAKIAPERIQAWQGRAEYLLDESAAGAASCQSVDDETLRQQWNGSSQPDCLCGVNGPAQNGLDARKDDAGRKEQPESTDIETNGFDLLRSEISGLLDVAPDQVRVFPEAELSPIKNQIHTPSASPPAFAQTVSNPQQTDFMDPDEPSRFLHAPAPTPPFAARSLLTRPAPALGKAPTPPPPPVSLSAGQIRFLDEEIAHLYGEVNRVLATQREITGHALSLLHEAREIIFSEPHRLKRAEYNLNQVRSLLERAHQSRRQSSRRGLRVLFYLSLWLAGTAAAAVALFLYASDLDQAAVVLLGDQGRVIAHLHAFLWTMITGSAGAVVAAILGFLAHIRSAQDFDRQQVVRFSVQPIMGVVLGILLYFLFVLLFASMQIDLTARAITRALPVVLALPAGLWQEWIYAFLYRMMCFFTLRPRRR